MKEVEVKRSWKATIIMLVVLLTFGTWGMVYSINTGANGQAYGCLAGMVIGVFLTVSQLCPKDR